MGALFRDRRNWVLLFCCRYYFFAAASFWISFVAFGAVFLDGSGLLFATTGFGIEILPFGTSFCRFADASRVDAIAGFRVDYFAFWTGAIFLTLVVFARCWAISK